MNKSYFFGSVVVLSAFFLSACTLKPQNTPQDAQINPVETSVTKTENPNMVVSPSITPAPTSTDVGSLESELGTMKLDEETFQ